jgi:hypothetical protein
LPIAPLQCRLLDKVHRQGAPPSTSGFAAIMQFGVSSIAQQQQEVIVI